MNPPPSSTASTSPPVAVIRQYGPGLVLVTLLALVARQLGHWLPLVGGPVFGILLGLLVRNIMQPGKAYAQGIQFSGKQLLQWSIIALGFGLDFNQVTRIGLHSLTVTLFTILAAFLAAWLLGRLLKVQHKLKLLIGIGTAICGGSAIAAVTPIIGSDEHDTAFAISTIFLFNLIAVLLFPPLGHLLHLSDAGFGLWAGTAINDTSSVVAAGYSYSKNAGDYATIVKLTRATLIIPICLVLALFSAWHSKKHNISNFSFKRIFPWFILWFLLASALRSMGLVPTAIQAILHTAAEFLIIIALTAIGLSAHLRKMVSTGPRPILLGLGVWLAVTLSSLAIQLTTGQL